MVSSASAPSASALRGLVYYKNSVLPPTKPNIIFCWSVLPISKIIFENLAEKSANSCEKFLLQVKNRLN